MPISEAKARANKKWDSANLDRIQLVVRAGGKEQIKAAADAAGTKSMNHYIVEAINARLAAEGHPIIKTKEFEPVEE